MLPSLPKVFLERFGVNSVKPQLNNSSWTQDGKKEENIKKKIKINTQSYNKLPWIYVKLQLIYLNVSAGKAIAKAIIVGLPPAALKYIDLVLIVFWQRLQVFLHLVVTVCGCRSSYKVNRPTLIQPQYQGIFYALMMPLTSHISGSKTG